MEKKKQIYAEAINPNNLVSYQEETVVSRMLVYEKAGTLSILAFPAGQRLSQHTASYDTIIHILEGAACVKIGEVENPINQGEIIILPAQEPYIISAITNCKMMLTVLHK